MIFITVGTHEQSMNRLMKKIEELMNSNVINEEVVIQKGFSTYSTKGAKVYDVIPYDKMMEYIKEANVVITHGGPATYLQAIALGKNPIVVPRLARFDEHVNDHQLVFAQAINKKGFNLRVVEDIDDLDTLLSTQVEETKFEFKSHNTEFCNGIKQIVSELFN